MHTRSRFIPITEAQVGMRLAESITLTSHGHLIFKLAQGHVLTVSCINQLIAHGAEQIHISQTDQRTDVQIALDTIKAAQHVQEIFSDADLKDTNTAALYQQVLIYRRES